MRNILILQGHPDARTPHFCHALGEAYARGARTGGHQVETLNLTTLDFDFLRSREEQEHGALSPELQQAQAKIAAADHLVLIYPLWLGGMPALVKGFFEQVARPGFAYDPAKGLGGRLLKGKSARVVITMGMPGLIYRTLYGAHSLKALKIGILGFVGIAPISETLIGMIEAPSTSHARWLGRLETFGHKGI